MRRISPLAGALLGGATGLAVIALMYLGRQALGLPFVPFDLFEWMARVLPGGILTLFIETMVGAIRALNLGSTDAAAKLVQQLMAVGLALGVAALFGALLAWTLGRTRGRGLRVGLAGGVVVFLAAAAVEVARSAPDLSPVSLLWLAVLLVGWGAALGSWLGAGPPAPLGEEGRALRRALLGRIALGSVALALASGGLGILLGERLRTAATGPAGGPFPGPAPGQPLASPPQVAGVEGVPRIEPAPGTRAEVTPTEEFYRIDINVDLGRLPTVAGGKGWKLEVAGLFDRPRSLSLEDLMAFPAVTQPATLCCISNPVGGDLIGTAFWTGVRLGEVLADLGLRPEATGLRVDAADGFHETVTAVDMMDPRTLLVYGMNGVALPAVHGYPLRIYIPNRYGMKQPKWISRLEAIARPMPGYWVQRGWSEEARPQIVSIIDRVALDRPANGRIPVGGIAWAGDRGIQKVEVRVDGGPWQEAALRVPTLAPLTWVQWRYDWPPSPGRHVLLVRATDGTGALQPEAESEPHPNGATGYHGVAVRL